MKGEYRVIPLVLLALYFLCSVCPERFLPGGMAVQAAGANEPHDCHNDGRPKPDRECRSALSGSLPPATVKFLHVLSTQAFLQHRPAASLAFDPLLRIRMTHFSTAGPLIPSLNIKLRI
jgi:hypothetical protein